MWFSLFHSVHEYSSAAIMLLIGYNAAIVYSSYRTLERWLQILQDISDEQCHKSKNNYYYSCLVI